MNPWHSANPVCYQESQTIVSKSKGTKQKWMPPEQVRGIVRNAASLDDFNVNTANKTVDGSVQVSLVLVPAVCNNEPFSYVLCSKLNWDLKGFKTGI